MIKSTSSSTHVDPTNVDFKTSDTVQTSDITQHGTVKNVRSVQRYMAQYKPETNVGSWCKHQI